MAVVEADTKVILMKDFIGELGIRQDEFQLEDQAHPSKIPLAPGESRRKGLYSYKDPHREQLVEYADKGVVYGQARRMSKMGRTNETPHVGVKAEFVGKKGPSGWETEESD